MAFWVFFILTLRKFLLSQSFLINSLPPERKSGSFYFVSWLGMGEGTPRYFCNNSRCSFSERFLANKPPLSSVTQFFLGPDPLLWLPVMGQLVLNTEWWKSSLNIGLKNKETLQRKDSIHAEDPGLYELYFSIVDTIGRREQCSF